MEQVTLEKVLGAAQGLSLNERRLLRASLDKEIREREGCRNIEEIAHEQGTRPLKFAEMLGDFWPEDDKVDDFTSQVRAWRQGHETQEIEE